MRHWSTIDQHDVRSSLKAFLIVTSVFLLAVLLQAGITEAELVTNTARQISVTSDLGYVGLVLTCFL